MTRGPAGIPAGLAADSISEMDFLDSRALEASLKGPNNVNDRFSLRRGIGLRHGRQNYFRGT